MEQSEEMAWNEPAVCQRSTTSCRAQRKVGEKNVSTDN